ncbi:hypothetical protein D3C73_1132800 [compost metagenome]
MSRWNVGDPQVELLAHSAQLLLPPRQLGAAFIQCAGQCIEHVAGVFFVQFREQRARALDVRRFGSHGEVVAALGIPGLDPFATGSG